MVRKKRAFDRGDIVVVSFSPAEGREQQGGNRPALVLSPASFNEYGMVILAPITQGGEWARQKGFSVSLDGTGTQTQGVILVNQVRSMDLDIKKARKVETAPDFVVDDALSRLCAILE